MHTIVGAIPFHSPVRDAKAWVHAAMARRRLGADAHRAIARVPAQHQEQLAPLLRLIAVERGAGIFELQLK